MSIGGLPEVVNGIVSLQAPWRNCERRGKKSVVIHRMELKRIQKLKRSDVKRFYNKLADDRRLKISTIKTES